MLVHKQWVEDYVNIPTSLSAEDLGDLLSTRVVEIEGIESEAESLVNIVVGVVESVTKHSNADSLNVCMVQVGKKELVQVICGGSNVREGMKVAMGLIGAKVRWHGEGDLIELVEAKIRGEKSFGMICASEEIGLGDMFPKTDEKEILDISDIDATAGTPLAEALGLDSIVYDIDNKSMTHRPDLWGHYGMAREVGALLDIPLTPMNPPAIVAGDDMTLKVDIQATDGCHRFTGVMVDGITIEPSPTWMQKKLVAVGVRPINNLVDITNYVMFELGQPTHAYDVDKLAADKKGNMSLTVRQAKDEEIFITLDGQERTLTKDMFVIADAEKSVLLGGIMGGQNSEVSDNTTRVLFESANFDAVVVRKMSQVLGLRTDGSARWEKSQDPTNAEIGLRRLVELTLQLCPNARVISNVADEGSCSIDQGPIEIPVAYFERKIGATIEKVEIIRILESLGFGVTDNDDMLSVLVPTWRATKDISIKEDLVEEIARIFGFENIPEALPKFEIAPAEVDPIRALERQFTRHLAYEGGCTQTSNYSFVSPAWLEKLGEDTSKHIELSRPLAKDRPLLRRHLIPGLLENMESNLHRFDTVNLFETGRVYRQEEEGAFTDHTEKEHLPRQYTLLSMAYAAKEEEVPFYQVTSRFRAAADRIGLEVAIVKKKGEHALVHPGRFADILVGDVLVGHVAELHPMVQETIGIAQRTAILEVNLDYLATLVQDKQRYQALSQYPVIERDIAFLVDTDVEHSAISALLIAGDELTTNVVLFDIYQGDGIPEGKKSMAYRITYRSDDRTLESKEVDVVHEKLIEQLKEAFNIEVR